MKNVILFLAAVLFFYSLHAQKIEMRASLYSGLAGLKGEAATRNSGVTRYGFGTSQGFTSNIYGKKPGFSSGAELQMSIPTKSSLIFNLAAGYERLVTVVNIKEIYPNFWTSFFVYEPAKGKTSFRTEFITLFPSVGYRKKIGTIKLDFSAGVILASCISSRAKGTATSLSSNEKIYSNQETDRPKKDIRPSLQASAHYKKFGLVAGYQWGLSNYCDLLVGSDRQLKAMMRFLKLGLSYRIK